MALRHELLIDSQVIDMLFYVLYHLTLFVLLCIFVPAIQLFIGATLLHPSSKSLSPHHPYPPISHVLLPGVSKGKTV